MEILKRTMNNELIIKKYAGIKWGLILLTCFAVILMIKEMVIAAIVCGIVFMYFLYLKNKYKRLLTNGKEN